MTDASCPFVAGTLRVPSAEAEKAHGTRTSASSVEPSVPTTVAATLCVAQRKPLAGIRFEADSNSMNGVAA